MIDHTINKYHEQKSNEIQNVGKVVKIPPLCKEENE